MLTAPALSSIASHARERARTSCIDVQHRCARRFPRLKAKRDPDYVEDYNRSPFYTQTERRFVDLITVQAIKNTLHYLQETNGEVHMYLHSYLVENPITSETDMDDYLSRLAATPLTRVVDPRRSSVPGPREEEEALRKGRKVSPRDVCERIMACRLEVAKELGGVSNQLNVRNNNVLRKALEATFRDYDDVTEFRGEKKSNDDSP